MSLKYIKACKQKDQKKKREHGLGTFPIASHLQKHQWHTIITEDTQSYYPSYPVISTLLPARLGARSLEGLNLWNRSCFFIGTFSLQQAGVIQLIIWGEN